MPDQNSNKAEKLTKTCKLIEEALQQGESLDNVILSCLPLIKDKSLKVKVKKSLSLSSRVWLHRRLISAVICVAVVLVGVILAVVELAEEECILDHQEASEELTRPLFDCNLCKNLKNITTVSNISREEFLLKYAFTAVPLVVTGVAKHWKALDEFSYQFFKDLYLQFNESFQEQRDYCQFFTYDGQFESLEAVFQLPEERVNMSTGKWYVGWNNCNVEIRKILRSLYETPHFLPQDSRAADTDWIFMGGQGQGAPIHLDAVELPSWQAQISGKKTWYLFPALECNSVCQPLETIMEVGDIILVDTNRWYHSTFVHTGNLSITIGTEYD